MLDDMFKGVLNSIVSIFLYVWSFSKCRIKKKNLAQKRKKEKVSMFVPYTEELNKNLWIDA